MTNSLARGVALIRAVHAVQVRSGLITQLDVLASELGSRAVGQRICSTQHVIEQRESRFNLKLARGAPPASRLLVELLCPVRWQGLKTQAFSSRHAMI
jgi:hypothetical protein